MTSRSLGHRAPLLWLVLPLIAGLATGKAAEVSAAGWLLGVALLSATIALVAAARGSKAWAPAILIAMFCAGVASYALHRVRLPSWDSLPPREARLGLRVDRVFAPRDAQRASGLATVVRADE